MNYEKISAYKLHLYGYYGNESRTGTRADNANVL